MVLAPVSGIAHAGYQLAHDRYGYLASLGAATIAGGAVTWLLRARHAARVSRWVTAATLAGVALALAGLGAAAWEQTRIWHDSETLWRAAVAADPACSLCRHKLGNVLLAAGRHAEAEAELGTAAALRPDRAGPLVSLGALLTEQGRHRRGRGGPPRGDTPRPQYRRRVREPRRPESPRRRHTPRPSRSSARPASSPRGSTTPATTSPAP